MASNWTDILPTVLKTPYAVYKNRKTIWYWIKRLQAATGYGKANILVVGKPATGKSVMISNLYGEVNDLTYDLPDTSTDVESYAIKLNEWALLFKTLPGQNIRERAEELLNSLGKNSNLEGIIYVVDFGYTEYRDPTARRLAIDRYGLDSIEKVREKNLEEEMEDFRLIASRISDSYKLTKRPKFVCIACNKIDLFHDRLLEAQDYYHPNGKGAFAKELKDLIMKLGSENVKIKVLPICSYERDFEWNGQKVKSNIGGTENRKAYIRNFIEELAGLNE